MNAPALPQPERQRWQPLRIGLVELFRYDSEEFWFRDGHLLLRGNNGTGKSKVLSLTLPLLLDANLRSSRVEPDGDPGKKMAWNLLLGDAYERRTGYSWVEFGRLGDDGQPQYLTLGLGLHAVAARSHQVDSWYFVADGTLRIGAGLWLLSAQRQVPARERLRELLGTHGQVFEQAQAYRRSVDERLFGLGTRRYDALLDTLIQLRQPQLSRRPDERALSAALTEALPPLAPELLGVVADALTQLEDLRSELQRTQRLHAAVHGFDQRYRSYAGMASRRQARGLRQAQTEFDNASAARHAAQAELTRAQHAEAGLQQRHGAAQAMLAGARMRLEVLLADPLNSAADRLERAAAEARRRDGEHEAAAADAAAAGARLDREQQALQNAERTAADAALALATARHAALAPGEAAGLQRALAGQPLLTAPADAVAAGGDFGAERNALLAVARRRRGELLQLRQRIAAHGAALADAAPLQQALADRRADSEDAAAAVTHAEDAAARSAQAHLDAWVRHFESLRELQPDGAAALDALAAWVEQPDGEHPARAALGVAHAAALSRLAAERAAVAAQSDACAAESQALDGEAAALRAGIDTPPPVPPWRAADSRAGRAGAPLWQLVDFAAGLPAPRRDGVEAALVAAGLLDAWVTPDGRLLHGSDGRPWHDAQWQPRPQRPANALSQALCPDPAAAALVAPALVQALLASVAYGEHDAADAEAWIAPDGRFRIAGLSGAAEPRPARHVGHAARQAARVQRLAAIAQRQAEIAGALAALQQQARALDARAVRIGDEWQRAPSDQTLRRALDAIVAAARAAQQARRREDEALARWQHADAAVQSAHHALQRDAADLRLPPVAAGLDEVERAVDALTDALHQLAAAVRTLRDATAALAAQRLRAADAAQQADARTAQRDQRLRLAEEARAFAAALQEALGAQVHGLKHRLARARAVVARLEGAARRLDDELRHATGQRAAAAQTGAGADQRLEQAAAARSAEVERLAAFAATGLLASALAGTAAALELPPLPWTIDPALTLARRIEQSLHATAADDEAWKRGQQQVTQDLAELQRALSALGEQATATTTDFGFVVHVQWRQQPRSPESLAALLQAELDASHKLLSAREREVLENHLQAEIASQIQALIRAANQQVTAINAELHRRPTGTGVRFRLLWQPLPEGQGAPAGLHAARERLLHTAAEMWTADDRRAFGALLRQRIQDESQRADAGGSLLDTLQRALDYRQWHQFRVERWQDGQWRRLSGPASSGERALGLTVPLFAAVASFYQGSPLAPRLMLLDEAFAGIDDAARAHCMGLVKEFDLDFVITSEREWGCYAELPGVAICQLQRREGIDAVHVSRWTWDGSARRPGVEPARAGALARSDDEPALQTDGAGR